MHLRLALAFAAAVAGGCTKSNGGTPAPDLGDTGTGGNGGGGGGVTTSCTGKSAPAMADDTWTIMSGGLMRTAHVHVPPSYDPTRGMPLVLDIHGYTSNGMQQDFLSNMTAKGNAAGFIVVFPEGTG